MLYMFYVSVLSISAFLLFYLKKIMFDLFQNLKLVLYILILTIQENFWRERSSFKTPNSTIVELLCL